MGGPLREAEEEDKYGALYGRPKKKTSMGALYGRPMKKAGNMRSFTERRRRRQVWRAIYGSPKKKVGMGALLGRPKKEAGMSGPLRKAGIGAH